MRWQPVVIIVSLLHKNRMSDQYTTHHGCKDSLLDLDIEMFLLCLRDWLAVLYLISSRKSRETLKDVFLVILEFFVISGNIGNPFGLLDQSYSLLVCFDL